MKRFSGLGASGLLAMGAVLLTLTPLVAATGAGGEVALAGNVTPALGSPPPGKVAVGAAGAAVDGRVAAIVQNGTSAPVHNLRVSGTATRADGGAVTTATTGTVVPSTLAPGAYGLLVLDFRKQGVAPGAAVQFRVKSTGTPSSTDPRLLAVGGFQLSAPLTGPVAQRLDVSVTNPGTRAVRGPLRITVMCFDEAAKPVTVASTRVRRAKLAAGKSVHASVPLTSLCPTYQVGAQAA